MKIFISYARRNQQRVSSVAQRIRQLGHEVWMDNTLAGGQAWWDEILTEIRACDAFVPMVSEASLESEACTSERGYANALGKSVVPVAVEPIRPQLLPADLGRLQLIDYSSPGEDAALDLARALSRVPPAFPLPAELPVPPPVPTSYLTELSTRLSAPSLSPEEQLSLLVTLEQALERARSRNDADERDTVLALVAKLEERPDLYAATERRLVAVKAAGDWQPVAVAQHPVQGATPPPPPQAVAPAPAAATPTTPAAAEIPGTWWLLPILLAWLGGLIAWLALKDRDAGKARAMLFTGLGLTVVYFIIVAASEPGYYT
jgi:TIR domain-containing protein